MIPRIISAIGASPTVQLVGGGAGSATPIKTNEAGVSFYGEVTAANFVTGAALATLCNVTQGTLINSSDPWLKLSLNGKTIFVAKRGIRTDISFLTLKNLGLTGAGKTVTIKGNVYKVRNLTCSVNDPYTAPVAGEWVSIWHGLIYGTLANYTAGQMQIGGSWHSIANNEGTAANTMCSVYDFSGMLFYPNNTVAGWMYWRPCLELIG